ncbi:U1snRNP-specific protein [Entamoeba marina]
MYGNVLDVHVRKALKMRGQAFVIFENVESAEKALKTLQNHMLFERPLHINFSKAESDIIRLKNGTFEPRARKLKDDNDEHKQKRKAHRHSFVEKNKVLFIDNLPKETKEDDLVQLFKNDVGYVAVRFIVVKNRGVAFIEFEDEVQAQVAMLQHQDHPLPQPIHIVFAKK